MVGLLCAHSSGDERFAITPLEYERAVRSAFATIRPLCLRAMPAKAKRRVVVLNEIAKLFEPERRYTEPEVNVVLRAVYPQDHVVLRRSLIDYRFLRRERDGSGYARVQPGGATDTE